VRVGCGEPWLVVRCRGPWAVPEATLTMAVGQIFGVTGSGWRLIVCVVARGVRGPERRGAWSGRQ
jgi:hypothetical protein